MLDDNVPGAIFNELIITAYTGRTPVMYQSKRQGLLETSTYSAEFMAMKTVVKEVMAVCYMLCCLGVK
eukprot:11455659-Ditylum_brightwellii.AAC.1